MSSESSREMSTPQTPEGKASRSQMNHQTRSQESCIHSEAQESSIYWEPITRRRGVLIWVATLSAWLAFSALYAAVMQMRYNGKHSTVPWWHAFVWQALGWSFWALATPVILWARRWFIPVRQLLLRLLFHCAFCALLVSIHLLFYSFITFWVSPSYSDVRPTFAQTLVGFVGMWPPSIVAIYWAILGVGYASEYYYRLRERELQAAKLKASLSQARLEALTARLQPHFLFNTMHTLAGLVRLKENEQAIEMIAGFSDLLRQVLDATERQEVTLGEELQSLGNYLDIQRIRFAERMRVVLDIDESTLTGLVPNLILQPLAENAINHGLMLSDGPGTLAITARRENNTLRIKVYNDGPELPSDWRKAYKSRTGLSNTMARLEELYGSRHEFKLTSLRGQGVQVTIGIPFHTDSSTGVQDASR